MKLPLREVLVLVRSRRVIAFLSFLTGAVCAATIVVAVGGAEATRSDILAALDAPSQRLIVATDDTGAAGISPRVTDHLRHVSTVDWAVAAGTLVDTALAGTPSGPVPTRWIDDLPEPTRIIAGRVPAHGEATIPVDVWR